MNQVIIYSTDSCGYWQAAKRYFALNNIKYTEKKVDSDPIARSELSRYGATGVPLIIVDGELIKGFNQARLDQLLKKPVIECPYCRASLRVPKTSGVILVTCPKCNEKFKVNSN
ncbi:MAG: glutaredoxin family protein, partial [Clostridia bacterium]|nr:glutaredoxin family protein [Clostridia bacterium]